MGRAVIIRLLLQRIRPERYEDWLRFTRDTGFPGMLAQPGCRAIRRLSAPDEAGDGSIPVCIMTEWDGRADLERFRASEAMRQLTEAGRGLSIPPTVERIYEDIPDPSP